MSDVELLTWLNHDRARTEELGERAARLRHLKELRARARRSGALVSLFASAFSAGAAAAFLAIGVPHAPAIFLIVSLLAAGGGYIIWEAR